MAQAVSSDPRNRATTTAGSPGNATAVDTSTTGFTAGAASRNDSAAAGATPCCTNRRAMGTEAHSQPGRATPAAPATGTASDVRAGSSRRSRSAGTKAAISPLTSTPNTRNGSACKQTATKTVAPVLIAGTSSSALSTGWNTTARTSSPHSTSTEVTLRRAAGGTVRTTRP